jgi:hypothetical protein
VVGIGGVERGKEWARVADERHFSAALRRPAPP